MQHKKADLSLNPEVAHEKACYTNLLEFDNKL
jgi:hypothetical protein